jgi:hypothetical protein
VTACHNACRVGPLTKNDKVADTVIVQEPKTKTLSDHLFNPAMLKMSKNNVKKCKTS